LYAHGTPARFFFFFFQELDQPPYNLSPTGNRILAVVTLFMEVIMAFTWRDAPALGDTVINIGPLALIHPLLQKLDIAGIIDRHLPADAQQEFSHGQVLSLLLAARLAKPTALIRVADWAEQSGADILWGLDADKLNDDRFGRSLDAFFTQRHSILASATAQALALTDLSLARLHFDTTHLVLYGAYESSQPRPAIDLDELRGDGQLSPAHITHGYLTKYRMLQVGMTSVVDELGALPIFSACLDGNRNGHPAIAEQYQLLRHHLPLPNELLMISDRGTFSAAHAGRLLRHGHHVLCSVPWHDYRGLYDEHRTRLSWNKASFLSIEQQRRRTCNSTLPREDYELAVWRHQLIDPTTKESFACRVIFVRSSADAKECRQRRENNIAKIQAGLAQIALKVQRAHPRSDRDSITRQVMRLFGKRDAARYFRWDMVALSAEEQAASVPAGRGYRRPTHRLVYTFDAEAAQADEAYDGLSALVTTAPHTKSADALFSEFKQQNYVERGHHQWKTPLAVCPVFLKNPRRVEALIALLQLALQAHQTLERCYRQSVASNAPRAEQRMTAETLLRHFQCCGLLVRQSRFGRVVQATRLSRQQRAILNQLSYPTPAQTLVRTLRVVPTG
jgi:transposase